MSSFEQVAEQLSDSSFLQNLSPPIQMALLMGSLVLLPAALASLTCFTRILIVLSFVRRGMSTTEIPPNSVLLGLTLFLTFFIPTSTKGPCPHLVLLPNYSPAAGAALPSCLDCGSQSSVTSGELYS